MCSKKYMNTKEFLIKILIDFTVENILDNPDELRDKPFFF